MCLLGVDVSSRDDGNYLAELSDRPTLAATLDPISWAVLSVGTSVTGLTSMGLRLIGLAIVIMTVVVLIRRNKGAGLVTLFVISILPLYLTIYFSQLRLAIALLIYIWIVTSDRMRNLSIPAGALAHSSFLIVLFPPLVLLIPFGFSLGLQFESDSLVALKVLSYLEVDLAAMPWYFGWEMVGIAFILGREKSWRCVLEIVAVVLAARIICVELSLDVGRRILEVGMLAYSPFFLLVQRRVRPSSWLTGYFVVLGILQTTLSLHSGVVSF
jgi:hypothetical protein